MKRSDDFGKRLAKPFFAVLLAMLVAITPTALAEAAPQADSKIPYIEYMMAIVEETAPPSLPPRIYGQGLGTHHEAPKRVRDSACNP